MKHVNAIQSLKKQFLFTSINVHSIIDSTSVLSAATIKHSTTAAKRVSERRLDCLGAIFFEETDRPPPD